MDAGPSAAKHIKEGSLLSRNSRDNLGRGTVKGHLGHQRFGHRVLVSHIVLEQLGRQGPEVVVVHGLIIRSKFGYLANFTPLSMRLATSINLRASRSTSSFSPVL